MFSRVLALTAALALAAATPAYSQDEDYEDEYDEEEEEEAYYAKESSVYVELLGSAGAIDGDETGGVSVIIGGHIETWLAMEGQYEWLQDDSTSLVSYGVKFVPLHGRIQPYLKAGLGLMGGRSEHSFLFMGRFGLGVSVFLNEQVAVTAGGTAALAANSNNAYLGSLGISYFFE
jgi:hypothetical protein